MRTLTKRHIVEPFKFELSSMFLRFAITDKDPDSNQPQGLFIAAQKLKRSGRLSTDEEGHLEEVLRWFNDTLPTPGRKWYASQYIFWYKVEATEVIRKMWELVNVLKTHDYHIEVLSTDWPGRIGYEDDCQVAALGPRSERIRIRPA